VRSPAELGSAMAELLNVRAKRRTAAAQIGDRPAAMKVKRKAPAKGKGKVAAKPKTAATRKPAAKAKPAAKRKPVPKRKPAAKRKPAPKRAARRPARKK